MDSRSSLSLIVSSSWIATTCSACEGVSGYVKARVIAIAPRAAPGTYCWLVVRQLASETVPSELRAGRVIFGAWSSVFGSLYVLSGVASEAAAARVCRRWVAGVDSRVPSHVVVEVRA